jgi:uncharacterized protein YggU (UPF0235/DUF167 family)
MQSFCQWEGDTLVLNILGRPRAKKTKIGKVIGHQLEVHVAENPVRGRATAHLVIFAGNSTPERRLRWCSGANVNKSYKAPKQLPAVIAKQQGAASLNHRRTFTRAQPAAWCPVLDFRALTPA